MEKIEIKFKDGEDTGIPEGDSAARDILKDLPEERRKRKGHRGEIFGISLGLADPAGEGRGTGMGHVCDSAEGLEILRHSASHVMAQAVKSLFPEAKITIGPAIKDGFYYDFDLDHRFSPEDLPRIEEKMREIIAQDLPIARRVVGREEAIRYFQDRGEPYKAELISEICPTPRSASISRGISSISAGGPIFLPPGGFRPSS